MDDINTILPHITLRLHIDHPSYEESYSFGYECAVAEVDEVDNPYLEGTEEYKHWLDGWWDGFYQEEPLFQLSVKPMGKRNQSPLNNNSIIAANEHCYHHSYSSILSTRIS